MADWMPRFFTCDISGCSRPSVRFDGNCDVCHRKLCAVHLSSSFHKCSEEITDEMFEANKKAQIQKLRSDLNDKALCQVATVLSGRKKCIVDHTNVHMGGANYHARIGFEDSSPAWLVRIPRGGWPLPLEEYLVRSEYATLKFLERTKVPSPKAFGFGIRGAKDNKVGVSYLLLEEMPGIVWYGDSAGKLSPTQELEKILNGIADIMIELHRHPFDQIGSLQYRSLRLEVSAVASNQTLIIAPTGPFLTSQAYYTAYAEQYLALIADEQTYTNFPIEAYLTYAFLKDHVHQLCSTATPGPERFYLKHIDDKGDHLLVDEDVNIVGVIDWQMARIAPVNEAFGPSLVTADMNALCNGELGKSVKDRLLADILRKKGAVKLANIMSAKDKVRRFMWGLGAETDWEYAKPLAEALIKIFNNGVKDVSWEEWKDSELQRRQGDERLNGLIHRLQQRQ